VLSKLPPCPVSDLANSRTRLQDQAIRRRIFGYRAKSIWSTSAMQITVVADRRVAEDLRTRFAAGYPASEKLSEILSRLNETSLSQLRRDHETGHLEHKIANASK